MDNLFTKTQNFCQSYFSTARGSEPGRTTFFLCFLFFLQSCCSSGADEAEEEDHCWNQLKQNNDSPDNQEDPEGRACSFQLDGPRKCWRSKKSHRCPITPTFKAFLFSNMACSPFILLRSLTRLTL